MTRSGKACLALATFALVLISAIAAVPVFAEGSCLNAVALGTKGGEHVALSGDTDRAPASADALQLSASPNGMDAPAQPSPKPKEKRRLVLMPSFNSFSPSDSKTQNRFGSSWPSIGFALAYKTQNMDPRRIEFRLDGIAQSSATTSAFVFPVGIGVNKIMSSSKQATTYAGLTANLYIAKLKSLPDNVDTGWQVKPGAGALVGANIGQKLNVQASYYLIPDLGGFNLSGLNVSAHLQVWTF